jgi:hypothetical protein
MTAGHATCSYCAKLKKLNNSGVVGLHYLVWDVSARAVHSVGARAVKRRCPGSYRRPRQPLGE